MGDGNIYTAFCIAADVRGTTWIDAIRADDLEHAGTVARELCAADWNCDPAHVECIGIAEGNVTILHWQD